jgi:hypothetical protein
VNVIGSPAADAIILHAGRLTMDEAVDLYSAYATRILVEGQEHELQALARARHVAKRAGVLDEYDAIRRAAVHAWRGALPEVQGPWILVGRAIANAAGAVYLQRDLDHDTYMALIGPWRQAVGLLVPVGPGIGAPAVVR